MGQSVVSSRALWLAPLAVLLGACKEMGPSSQPVSLSVSTRSASLTPQASAGPATSITIGTGANSITISTAQIVLSEIELSPSGTCSTTDENDDCEELETGPSLIDLPVDGSTKVILDASVPAGTYAALEAKLDAVKADEEEGANAFLTAHPDLAGISVKVTGVFTDASNQTHNFTFTSEADAEIEAAFNPPVTVGAGTSNLTISLDISSWFKDAGGAVIDPTDATNAAVIEHNIRQSFHAFEDDNHDGEDDNQEQGSGH